MRARAADGAEEVKSGQKAGGEESQQCVEEGEESQSQNEWEREGDADVEGACVSRWLSN